MDLIKKLFGINPKLNIQYIGYDDFKNNSKNIFKQLVSSKIDVFIIKNVFTKEEIKTVIKGVCLLKENDFDTPHVGAKTFPKSCSSGQEDENVLSDFFEKTKENNFRIDEISGINISQKFEKLMNLLNGNKRVILAQNRNDFYLKGTYRLISSEEQTVGLTQVHTGYDYAKRNNKFSYTAIKNKIDTLKQLSIYTLLRKPDSGGEFTVFNFDRQEYNSLIDNKIIINKKTKKEHKLYSKNNYETIKLEVGDVLTFTDFKLWHRVEKVLGETERMSYGCWGSFDFEKENFYYWS